MAFRAIAVNETGSSGGLVVTKPSGTAENDILIAFTVSDNASDTFTWPSGFAEVTGSPITCTLDNQTIGMAIKVAGGSEPANYTLTCSNTIIGGIAAFSGCATTGVPHRIITADDDSSDATPWDLTTGTFTGGNTSTSCDIVFYGGSDTNTSGDVSHTAPAGFIIPTNGDIDDGFRNAMFAYKENAASGETGAYSATGTQATASAGFGAIALALELTGGGGGRTTKNTRSAPLGIEIGMNWRGGA